MAPSIDASNQSPPLVEYNVFRSDRALVEELGRLQGSGGFEALDRLGTLAGGTQAQSWARIANEYPPALHTHDRYGNRIDEVEYHPYYHRLMSIAVDFGLHAAPWRSDEPSAHLLRAAKFYVWGQVEAGHGCPISMTYAAVPALRVQPELAAVWEQRLTERAYDPRLRAVTEKASALCGMALTEKQGGSDLRANRTRAAPARQDSTGDTYLLTGHKWFCSAPMSDAFLVLAQADAGLTCFLMPRILADGSRNRIFMQRLKDKLGNRSNASAEIELEETHAVRIGEEGRGVQTIVEMVNLTRMDCMNGSAGLMRQATAQAIHHAAHRTAFGKLLLQQPLMQNVLADLALESEAAMLLTLRIARAVDRGQRDERESMLRRLGTALGKYAICKRAPAVVGEALECLGGNGYVEESGMPRLYREAPLNSIWEGCGNINALDVLRILERAPEIMDAFRAEIEPVLGDARIRAAFEQTLALVRDQAAAQARARTIADRLALLWQAALMAQNPGNPGVELFVESRLAGRWGRTLGTLAPSTEHESVVQRARPALQNVEYSQR